MERNGNGNGTQWFYKVCTAVTAALLVSAVVGLTTWAMSVEQRLSAIPTETPPAMFRELMNQKFEHFDNQLDRFDAQLSEIKERLVVIERN